MNELVSVARKALSGRLERGPDAEAALRNMIQIGTSANGARAKEVIAWNKTTSEIGVEQLGIRRVEDIRALKIRNTLVQPPVV